MDPALIERAKRPNLLVDRGLVEDVVARLNGPYVLVSQPSALPAVPSAIREGATTTVVAESLDEDVLSSAASSLPAVAIIVGVGGGTTMEMAKYLAWKTGITLVLVPSVVSVDACVTNTVAVRREGDVQYEGFVVADAIVVDHELIARAPARLNRAGVGDLVSIHTARSDWALGARAGTVHFDAGVDASVARVLDDLYVIADEVAVVSELAIEFIVRAYARVNALLLEVGHSGPEEGSEHYFAFAAESITGRGFVHGEIIGLGTVLMSGLQGNDQERVVAFLDRCGVEWHPEQLGLDGETLTRILLGLPAFVRRAGLPRSIIDERPLDRPTIAAILASIGAGGRPA